MDGIGLSLNESYSKVSQHHFSETKSSIVKKEDTFGVSTPPKGATLRRGRLFWPLTWANIERIHFDALETNGAIYIEPSPNSTFQKIGQL